MTKQSASASVEVAADPATAFRIFTDEIDLWWVRGPINFFDASRAVGMRIEPGEGGRILEVYRLGGVSIDEDVLELGRITAWEPGSRLAYRSSVDDTETEIRFEPVDGGTRVSVEQTLVQGGEKAFYFWLNVIPWFVTWTARRDSTRGDLDAHFARSTASGASIVTEIHQHGYRCYEAADLEGHHWTFVQAGPAMK